MTLKLPLWKKRQNVSAYTASEPPAAADADRKIRTPRPLYSAEAVIAAANGSIAAWTERCTRQARDLGFDDDELLDLLRETLRQGGYKDSEWCEQSSEGPWAACDAYAMRRQEWNDRAFKYLGCEYYVKFAIAKTGTVLLLVSCHT